jgi:hypothetical protein
MTELIRALSQIENRRDMVEVMEATMSASSQSLREKQRYGFGTTLVKSFLVESNVEISHLSEIDKNVKVQIKETEDSTLHYLRVTTQSARGKKKRKGDFILDSAKERYWVFHTLDRSDIANYQIGRIVRAPSSGLDHFWLSEAFLRGFLNGGQMKEFSAGIDSDLPDEESEFIGHMSIRVWGKESSYALDVLQDAENIGPSVSLKAVSSRILLDSEDSKIYADERLTVRGRMSASGTSAVVHLNALNDISDKYSEQLDVVEKLINEDVKASLDFYPFLISPREGKIKDVKGFVERIVQNMPKMRIVGFPTRVSDNFYRIPSVDLHNGDKLDLEVFSGGVRVVLWPLSCGNTIFRLESNLQRHVRADMMRE